MSLKAYLVGGLSQAYVTLVWLGAVIESEDRGRTSAALIGAGAIGAGFWRRDNLVQIQQHAQPRPHKPDRSITSRGSFRATRVPDSELSARRSRVQSSTTLSMGDRI